MVHHCGIWALGEKKYLGAIKKKVTYGETFFLLIASDGVDTKPDIEEITKERFNKKLVQKNFDREAIEKYISQKVTEASKKENMTEAFNYLEQFFSVED